MKDLSFGSTWGSVDIEKLSVRRMKKYIVKEGWNVDAVDPLTGRVVLFDAICARRPDLVCCLLGFHPNVDIQNNEGDTALHLTTNVPLWIINREENILSRHFPRLFRKDLLILQALLGANANVNIQNKLGATPLHNALVCQNTEAVSILFDTRRVNIHLEDIEGRNCLHKASECPTLELLQKIVSMGGDPRKEDKQGLTPADIVETEFHFYEMEKEERRACVNFLRSRAALMELEKTQVLDSISSGEDYVRFVAQHKTKQASENQKEKE